MRGRPAASPAGARPQPGVAERRFRAPSRPLRGRPTGAGRGRGAEGDRGASGSRRGIVADRIAVAALKARPGSLTPRLLHPSGRIRAADLPLRQQLMALISPRGYLHKLITLRLDPADRRRTRRLTEGKAAATVPDAAEHRTAGRMASPSARSSAAFFVSHEEVWRRASPTLN